MCNFTSVERERRGGSGAFDVSWSVGRSAMLACVTVRSAVVFLLLSI